MSQRKRKPVAKVNEPEVVFSHMTDLYGRSQMDCYLDIKTGKIIYVHEEFNPDLYHSLRDDSEELPEDPEHIIMLDKLERGMGSRYLEIPGIESYIAYNFMVEFIDGLDNTRVQERLAKAIQGKGAFRRFKDLLFEYPDVRESWFEFEREKQKAYVYSWLRKKGFDIKKH